MKRYALRKRIEESIGRQLLKKYYQQRDGYSGAFMMPPIPDCRFIDKLPENIELEGQTAAEKGNQDGYEAEVKVYRYLEEVKSNVVVLHQVLYTHDQYAAFLLNHNCTKKNCKQPGDKNKRKKGSEVHPCHQTGTNLEGETDFVVIGDNFVTVFEVKGLSVTTKYETSSTISESSSKYSIRRDGMPLQRKNAVKFEACCEDAVRQRNRMVELIKSIDPFVMVYDFTIFSNISKEEVDERYRSDKTLLFSEDIVDFNRMIDDFEKNSPINKARKSGNRLKHSLLGLWCIDQGNNWKDTACSLPQCIMDTNEKLRRALVTRKSVDEAKTKESARKGKGKGKIKKYPENQEMIEAPDLFKNFLKISCLTNEQLNVFHSEKRFLWVEGPAGSGKSVVMLGKIIHLALTTPPENRILIMMVGLGQDMSEASKRCLKVLNDIREDIKCLKIIHDNNEKEAEIDYRLGKIGKSSLLRDDTSKIVLLVSRGCLGKSMKTFIGRFDHVFVDDYQKLPDCIRSDIAEAAILSKLASFDNKNIISEGLLPIVKESDSNKTGIWIFCDEAQSTSDGIAHIVDQHKQFNAVQNEFRTCFVNSEELSVVLRNTYEISTLLSKIRETFKGRYKPVNLLQQKTGHFLRGPKPVIYLLRDSRPAVTMKYVLTKELGKLKGSYPCLENKDIAVIFKLAGGVGMDNMIYRRDVILSVLERWNSVEDKINLTNTSNCMSAEWPASIFVHRCEKQEDKIKYSFALPLLYIAISRARVYSTVIMFNYKPNDSKYTDRFLEELKECRNICRIIEH